MSTCIASRIYGLPKTHKDGIPMRPIVSTINCPGYEISKYISKVLQNISDKEKYNIKNSYQFKDFISTVIIPDKYLLVSFDVKSLFTNVPLDLARKIIDNNWQRISQFTKINKKAFLNLFDFVTSECSIISFNNILYQQVNGLQMGSPLAPILSDLVLEFLFDNVIPKLKVKPLFLKKYVDDTICAIPEEDIQHTLDALNNFHPMLQFTIETEHNNQINFLDMTLIKCNGNNIITNWYKKETASNRILNYYSCHPKFQKYYVASGLADRILSLSHIKFLQDNINQIKNILYSNSFPESVINKILKKAIMKNRKNNLVTLNCNNGTAVNTIVNNRNDTIISNSTADQNIRFSSILYVPNLSDNIRRIIFSKNKNLKLSFKPLQSNNIYNTCKDKIQRNEKSNVVYEIPCGGCNRTYIGETGRMIKDRIREHKIDLKNINKNNPKTALIQHTKDTTHTFEYDNFKILDFESNMRKRRFLESTYIIKTSNTVNLRTDTNNINEKYISLIKHS